MSNIKSNIAKLKEEQKPVDDGTTKVPTGMLEALQKQLDDQSKKIEELSKRPASSEDEEIEDEDEVDENIARFKEYEGGIVISYNQERGTWSKYDKERREDRLMIELTVLNGDNKKVIEVDYLRFLEDASDVSLKILDTKVTPVVEEKGVVSVKTVDGYKTLASNKKVRQKVKSTKAEVQVKMPDGGTKWINIDFINM